MLEYSVLFNAITDAINILVEAQQKAEEIILDASADSSISDNPHKL